MSQSHKRKKTSGPPSTQRKQVSQSPRSQTQIEEKVIHLQTILMLSQLNSAYFQLNLSLLKITNKLESEYFRRKMNAFLRIANFKNDSLDVKSADVAISARQEELRIIRIEGQQPINFVDEKTFITDKIKKCISKGVDSEEIACNLLIRLKIKLERIVKMEAMKRKNLVNYAFYKIYNHEIAIGHILSQKSSKIQTNDSQKSKTFKRSVERRVNRKSFSMQKGGAPAKHEFYVPVKYQPRLQTPTSVQSDQPYQVQISPSSSNLNRYLQEEKRPKEGRVNQLMVGRQKKGLKCSSTKKYNTSAINQERQEKIKELEYLKRKYKKLIDEFNWFSERFLKVIEEEEYVQ